MSNPTSWLNREAPRYTSYPTAHHFSADVGAGAQHAWLSSVPEDAAISVYVHIPFCHELCWFCGCHTKMTKRYEPIAAYVQVLLAEIALLKQHAAGRGKLHNIHFGGGSPSLLSGEDMVAILEAIASAFEFVPSGELAIELDPRTTTPENIALYAAMGFNRVSIGLQDFAPKVQQAINRIQPYDMVEGVVKQLRAAGISAINGDLIYGLPHQTRESFAQTLRQTLALDPERIALFSYAHLPELKKHQRLIPTETLPSAEEKLAIFALADSMLAEAGYVAVGIDHFAKATDPLAIAMQNGSMKRNFQGYVTDANDVIVGVGCSSISQYPQGYVQNSAHTPDYRERISKGELAGIRGWSFRGDDLVRKQVIDDLMCFMQADVAAIARAHGLAEDYFAAELAQLASAEFADIVVYDDAGVVRLITPHRMAVRVVAAVFDPYANASQRRFSKVA